MANRVCVVFFGKPCEAKDPKLRQYIEHDVIQYDRP